MKSFIGITGTTCVGKSEVAIELANLLECEIISADSMQIYKGMDIGTAKITFQQMRGVKHHMIDVVEPNCDFSSFEYAQMVGKIIDSLNSLPILVGGTGFYFDCLVYPPEFDGADKGRRAQLQRLLAENGLDYMVNMLLAIDCETANKIDLKNPVRVLRAIEIAESGKKQSQGTTRSNPKYSCKIYVLQRSRENLYEQIDRRVDNMIQLGLLQEVKNLVEKYGFCQNSAFSAIGYKEIIEYLKGKCSFEQAISQVKLNTRHYAKRQISYFKRMNNTVYINVEGKNPLQIAREIAYDLQNGVK